MDGIKNETGGNDPLDKKEQDRDDFNNEMAGRDVGRMRRFLPEAASPVESEKRKDRERQHISRLLALLKNDPEYAEAHQNAMDILRHYELAAERALEDAVANGDQDRIDEIRRYQVDVLGTARERLTGEDNPASMDELNTIQQRIEESAPFVIEAAPSESIPNSPGTTSEVRLPPITR